MITFLKDLLDFPADLRSDNDIHTYMYMYCTCTWSLSDLRCPRISSPRWKKVNTFFFRELPSRLLGVRDSYWVAYKLIVWYWRKNINLLEKLCFSMKNIIRENFSRHPNLRFRDFHQNPNDEISDFHQIFFLGNIFHRKKKFFEKIFNFSPNTSYKLICHQIRSHNFQ